MADNEHDAPPAGEELARLYFELVDDLDRERLADLLHPDVEIQLRKMEDGRLLRGKDDVVRFFDELPDRFPVFEPSAEVFRALDDDRIVVEGRLRWMDEQRVLRDDPIIWALEFRDGRLLRSTSARSVSEAQAILSTGSPPASASE